VRGDVLAEDRLGGEGAGEGLDGVGEYPAGDAVENHEQRDEHHHHREHRRVLHGADDDALDHHAEHEGEHHGEQERRPVGHAGVDQAPGEVGGEHRHLALREVHEVRRLVDHHQRQREAGVDAAGGKSREHLVQEGVHD
jgi:hypothetical protein